MGILLTIILACIILGGMSTLILVLFGLGAVAIFAIKILMALGLIYMGIKLLNMLF